MEGRKTGGDAADLAVVGRRSELVGCLLLGGQSDDGGWRTRVVCSVPVIYPAEHANITAICVCGTAHTVP